MMNNFVTAISAHGCLYELEFSFREKKIERKFLEHLAYCAVYFWYSAVHPILKCLLSNRLTLNLISRLEIQIQVCLLWTFGLGVMAIGEKPCQTVRGLPSVPTSQFVVPRRRDRSWKNYIAGFFIETKIILVIMTVIENSDMPPFK